MDKKEREAILIKSKNFFKNKIVKVTSKIQRS